MRKRTSSSRRHKIILVRKKPKGLYTASDAIEYQFTQDTDTETQKYVPIKHLSIEGIIQLNHQIECKTILCTKMQLTKY